MDEKLGSPAGDSAQLITFVKDRAGHDKRYAIDSSKIKNELHWTPDHKFRDGLGKTIDWYLENEKWMKNVLSGAYEKYYEEQYLKR
jgi:dTDP-glucose 4,6-dehydratase